MAEGQVAADDPQIGSIWLGLTTLVGALLGFLIAKPVGLAAPGVCQGGRTTFSARCRHSHRGDMTPPGGLVLCHAGILRSFAVSIKVLFPSAIWRSSSIHSASGLTHIFDLRCCGEERSLQRTYPSVEGSGASQYKSHVFRRRVMGTWVSQFVRIGTKPTRCFFFRGVRAAGQRKRISNWSIGDGRALTWTL